jgi:hypothetical protein
LRQRFIDKNIKINNLTLAVFIRKNENSDHLKGTLSAKKRRIFSCEILKDWRW